MFKKSLKKSEKSSSFNTRLLLQKIRNGLTERKDLIFFFFKLRKMYNKTIKLIFKELHKKKYEISFMFMLKKSYSTYRPKRKKTIKKRLKKRLMNIKPF